MTRRLRRSHLAVLAGFTAIGVTILVAVILLTQTDWGRRRVLAFGLDQLASRVHGEVKVADIRGNLLSGVRLENIEITDTAGRPFLRADTLAFRYSLTSLLRKHLAFSDMSVVNGIVVLDQPPGEEWNYSRIFPTGAPKPHRGPGFGSWIQIHNLQVRNSHLVVRAAWTPRAELSGAERARTITRALAPTNREWIAPINGGYQTISQFYRVNGRFPFLRLADPDSVNRLIEIAELSMIALPFRPPAVDVRDLAALLVVTDDSLLVPRMRFVLAGTRGRGRGAYALNGRSAHVEVALVRAALADARFIDPTLPDGGGHLRLALNRQDGRMRIVASNLDMLVEGGTFRGLADFQIGRGTFRVGPSDLRFANVDTRLVKRYINDAPLEAPGTLAGHVRLVGTPAALRVDGNTSYTERGRPNESRHSRRYGWRTRRCLHRTESPASIQSAAPLAGAQVRAERALSRHTGWYYDPNGKQQVRVCCGRRFDRYGCEGRTIAYPGQWPHRAARWTHRAQPASALFAVAGCAAEAARARNTVRRHAHRHDHADWLGPARLCRECGCHSHRSAVRPLAHRRDWPSHGRG